MALMRAPNGLGKDGGALWRAVAAFVAEHPAGSIVLDGHEKEILAQACRLADRLTQMSEALEDADLNDATTLRLLSEERQSRLALANLLTTKLGLPSGLPAEVPKKGHTPRSRRAQTAARARWGTSEADSA